MYPAAEALVGPLHSVGVTCVAPLLAPRARTAQRCGVAPFPPRRPPQASVTRPSRATRRPNLISVTGLCVGVATAVAILNERFVIAMALFAVHQLLDAMDGTMARRFKMCSEFGAKLDEACDQLSGAAISLAAMYTTRGIPWLFVFLITTTLAMLLVRRGLASSRPRRARRHREDHILCLEFGQ